MNGTCRSTMLALLLLPALAAGCGGGGLPPQTDIKSARAALTAALDAWKEGHPAEKQRELSPPVDLIDLHWGRGVRLVRYEVETEEPFGLSARFTVKLFLADGAAEARPRTAVYLADTGPVMVIRPEF